MESIPRIRDRTRLLVGHDVHEDSQYLRSLFDGQRISATLFKYILGYWGILAFDKKYVKN